MNKKILIIALVIVFPFFNVCAKPGGTYTLTGDEKSIDEIIKADVDKYPELYKGENLKIYIGKFKNRNIGRLKRKLHPGDRLHFPETEASIKVKDAKLEEERKQQMEAQQAIYVSFTEKLETDWIADRTFRELASKLKGKGFWADYWTTEIDGRCSQDGKIEYKLKCGPVPSEGQYEWLWNYFMDEKEFEKLKNENENNGLTIVHEQFFTLSNGEKRYQAVWHMHEE